MAVPETALAASVQPLTLLSEDERIFAQSVREFASAEIRPHVLAMDEEAAIRPEIVRHCFELGLMGVEVPEGAPRDVEGLLAMEKRTSKEEVLESLAAALEFGRRAAESATPEQLAAKHDFFGNQVSGRAMYLFLVGHLQEHLGQEIAYARSNGVVPPWSRPQPKPEY